MLRVVAGAEHPAVDQPGRWRHLSEDGRRILLAGVVEDPGQELGPFPWREHTRGHAPGHMEQAVPCNIGKSGGWARAPY